VYIRKESFLKSAASTHSAAIILPKLPHIHDRRFYFMTGAFSEEPSLSINPYTDPMWNGPSSYSHAQFALAAQSAFAGHKQLLARASQVYYLRTARHT
jgi:hypothetical protein